ncbi:cation diffusion facilitator family transporter [Lachnospiraceae bacterium 46-61]
MTDFILKHFVKSSTTEEETRKKYGILSGYVGILCNVILFAVKFFAGIITHSVSITADALNNLSDVGSSVATLLGFKLADRPPDKEHPFGHGRYEYISGFVVSLIIILMGIELLKASFEKIISPQQINFRIVSFLIMLCSIGVKLWLCFFNKKVGKMISSATLQATAMDSLSDVAATSAVIIGMLVNHFFHFNIDGYMGVIVAGFILYTGVTTAKETLNPLLGTAPPYDLIEKMKKEVLSYDGILGVHDLIVHSYGAEKKLVSLHAEVSAQSDILKIHEVIDTIERDIKQKFMCDAVIHMDPIDMEDEQTKQLYHEIKLAVKDIDDSFNMHDFRVVKSMGEVKLFFDVAVPFPCQQSNSEIAETIKYNVEKLGKNYIANITIDRLYTP